MEPKSTAKSKRMHSLHGRKSHPSPSSSASAAAAKKKPSAAARHQKLPSNWEQYEDDIGEVGEKEGEAVVRSKGADFGYLIEETRKEGRKGVVGDAVQEDMFFSIDISQGSGFMLSSRAETLINWCEDDNFIVDDDSSNYEVSSLSMDLKALAGQLSKMNMPQRLFMEDFLFSDELAYYSTGSKSDHKPSIIPSHNTKLSATEPEITTEMVQSLSSTSEQENNCTNLRTEKESSISKSVILDDALDDLLAETCVSLKIKDDDNYQKGSSNMDNSKMAILDDLLERNLEVKKENDIEAAKKVDDFDSWFDSL